MRIIEIKNSDKEKWNDFVLANRGEFLQSWEWGEFQGSTGKKIWRVAVADENNEFISTALIIKNELPLGKNYLYCPRGPVSKLKVESPFDFTQGKQKLKVLELIFNKTKEIAEKENPVFLKLEPVEKVNLEVEPPLGGSTSKFILTANLQPHDTLILDLNKTEEELLAQMKQKTRYNIRLAEKHGVKVRVSDKDTFESDFEKFWTLTEETTSRDKFQSHSKKYYRGMLALHSLGEGGLETLNGEISPQKPIARLFLAEFEGKILAANIMIFFGERATYLHGASGAEYRNLMAPYLLQWEQIRKARQLGYKEYDFWGIIANEKLKTTLRLNSGQANEKVKLENNKNNSWQGITRFKTGFGGREINYPDAVDIVYQPIVYKAIKVAKKIKAVLK